MIKKIKYTDLIFWGENPRFGLNANHDTPEKAVNKLFELNQTNMTNLAKDIASFGLVPSDLPIVKPLENGKYKVYEGNRRIACVYSLNDNNVLSFKPTLQNVFSKITLKVDLSEITCLVENDLGKIYDYLDRIHTTGQSGVSRVSWGTTENNILKNMKNELSNQPDKGVNSILEPHFNLLNTYPILFTDLIENIRPTNADRILKKTSFKEIVGTIDYSDINPKQAKAISSTLVYAHEQSRNVKGGLSRKYDDNEIKNELVPYYLNILDGLKSDKYQELFLNVIENTKITEGTRLNVNNFVLNPHDFESLTFTPSPNLVLDEDEHIISTNAPGKYSVTVRGFIDNREYSSGIIDVEISKKKEVIPKIKEVLFKHDFDSNYTIDISDPINNFILQANKLNLNTFSYIANACLRIVLEDSLNIFTRNKNITLPSNNKSNLEKYLISLKNYYNANQITTLDLKSKLGFNKIKKILDELDPSTFSKELHPLAHNITTMEKSKLLNLSNRVTNLLVIISEELKP